MLKIDSFIYNDDCFNILPSIPDKSIDMILTDPPYGCSSCKWDTDINLELLFKEYKRIIKDHGTICIFGINKFTAKVIMTAKDIYRYSMVWVKPNSTSPLLANKQPLRRYEDIMVFYKKQNIYNPQFSEGKPYKWNSKRSKGEASNIQFEVDKPIDNDGKRYPTNVLEFKQERSFHSTGKPSELMEYLIKMYTNEDMVVLDTFLGSASTVVGCIRSNRRYIGIEKDKEIYEKSLVRVDECLKENSVQ